MEHFQEQKSLRGRTEYPQLVKHYNETGVMLMRFELEVQVGQKILWNLKKDHNNRFFSKGKLEESSNPSNRIHDFKTYFCFE